jgi:hypothetical protein
MAYRIEIMRELSMGLVKSTRVRQFDRFLGRFCILDETMIIYQSIIHEEQIFNEEIIDNVSK